MSHYDDIAAYNFAFCWSLRGDRYFCLTGRVESLKKKWFGASSVRAVCWMLLRSPAKR
jgi:hypothetical protein